MTFCSLLYRIMPTPGCRKEHILITGGAGYIGTTLVSLLLTEGYEVTVYDLFTYGVRPLLYHSPSKFLHLMKGDILDKERLTVAMQTVDSVIHLAAIPGYPTCDRFPEKAKEINVNGTRNVIDIMKPGARLIFASTGVAYGQAPRLVDEETPLNPISLYAKTKADGEKMVIGAGGLVLRIATLFGVSNQMRLDLFVNYMTAKAIKNKVLDIYEGEFQRTFLHVSDMGRAFLMGLNRYDVMKGQVFNVGDNSMDMTKQMVANVIQSKVPGCKIIASSLEDKEKRDYIVRFDKIKALGFKASVTLDEGIDGVIKFVECATDDEFINWRFYTV